MPHTPDFRDLVIADLSQYLRERCGMSEETARKKADQLPDQAVKDFEKSLESGE
ncbi:hypothetical protein SEA_NUEVOMUNDO_38 [Mycobacterium phage NuevoMundo]|uniref:Uncharacterized protein n=1 Tax=Mycobacterium phage MoMoMixon TaxID=1088865 RepID=G8ICZ8_9CAUD|nr:hypothetical protein MOMOMIXON_36 [Mycobacterium phage MoMoMixon]AVJ48315.1 hypothetical protein SEA_NUEVOMUNDO_38 [Mycobacterium phage NuevoMundo]QAY08144.1 hypothetical protein SEA_KAMRYN_35 [Mycobacterium phage Kamryn]QAY12596.1 hypothetical protein SEA_NIDHOGG_36 [Mycobacterium phage Nidhogg]WMI34188.1 hypothetical protein SEA_CARAVAN_33 [Mycobacterium phage Caravan]AER25636.1 hypothetical protein MOMOMIXON_36 [Mycobacterium phage MoMoMixon]